VFYAIAPAGTPVAIKVFRAVDGAFDACRREFWFLYAADQRSTVPALRYGASPAGSYLVMAYLPGYLSVNLWAGGSMSHRQLCLFGAALARALDSLQGRGLVHCDVKPSNLLVRGKDVRLIDFGIARYTGEVGKADGKVHCSRGWAAPEQLRTTAAASAVDVFAWGCVLAYLAGGVHPFASRDEREWILRVQSTQPDLYGLPPALHAIVRATLERDPQNRPSARELATTCQTIGLTS
jgi:serine/threonine protein kinase